MSSFIDAVEQRAQDIVDGHIPVVIGWSVLRQALTETLAAAGAVAYLRDDNGDIGDLEITGQEDRAGFPVFTAPPADERDARIAELEKELRQYRNAPTHPITIRDKEIVSLRTQLAAAQAALESDPLTGAAKWLREAIADCQVGDLQFRLGIGYNRAKRLFDAAIAPDQSAAGSDK